MSFLPLRSGNAGPAFIGQNQDDAVLWDATEKAWFVGAIPVVGGVSSVFGRTGAVVAVTGDYDSDQITNLSTVPGASVSDALDALLIGGGAVVSVFGRVGAIVATTGDYTSSQVSNLSGVAGASVTDALNALSAAIPAVPVSSVFGRVGAVVAANGDYTSSQVSNASAVAGATVSAALNTLGSAISALSLTTTAPLAGGGVIISGLTLSVADASNVSKGVVPAITSATSYLGSTAGTVAAWLPALNAPANPGDNTFVPIVSAGNFTYGQIANAQVSSTANILVTKLAAGSNGQALITTAGGAAWGTDFTASVLTTTGGFEALSTTGILQIGTNVAGAAHAAQTGNLRLFYQATCYARASTDASDVQLWDFGLQAASTLTLGNPTMPKTVVKSGVVVTISAGSTYDFSSTILNINGAVASMIYANNGFHHFFLDNATAGRIASPLILGGGASNGTGSCFGSGVALTPGTGSANQNGNIYFFTSGTANADNGLSSGIVQHDRDAAPTGNPTAAFYHWSETGGLPTWRTVAGNIFQITGVGSATASAGGGAAVPLTVLGFVGVQVMVAGVLTAAKIAVFSP